MTELTWQQIGSLILAITVFASGAITQLPLKDKVKMWVIFALNLLGVIANFFVNTLNE